MRTAPGDWRPGWHVIALNGFDGNLVIGPGSMGRKANLHAGPDETVNWAAFGPFATGAGSPWLRYIDYYGKDLGFIDWSRRRRIE